MNLTLSTTVPTALSPAALAAVLQRILDNLADILPAPDTQSDSLPESRPVRVSLSLLSGRHTRLPDSEPTTAGAIPPNSLPPPEAAAPKSPALRAARQVCLSLGWYCYRHASPDFWLIRPATGQVCGLIVSAARGRRSKRAQLALARLLSRSHGVPIASWSPQDGFALLALPDALPSQATPTPTNVLQSMTTLGGTIGGVLSPSQSSEEFIP